jgi:hypothetical protein
MVMETNEFKALIGLGKFRTASGLSETRKNPGW